MIEDMVRYLKEHPLTEKTLVATEQGMQTVKEIQAGQAHPNRHQRRAATAWLKRNRVIVRNPHHDANAGHPTDVR